MSKDYYVGIIIPTFNNVNEITPTIKSALNQTFDSKRLKIVIIDNCSTDGTYELVLEFAKKHMDQISVFRLSETTKTTRVHKKLAELLRFSAISYSTVLYPGDILYPDCVHRCTTLFTIMKNFTGRMIIFEVDLFDENGSKKIQSPIFEDNCILTKKIHNSLFLTTGIGHKVQTFYVGLPVSIENTLLQTIEIINYSDWFYKFFHFFGDSIYINESLACIRGVYPIDPINDLLNRLLVLRRREFQLSADMPYVVGGDFSENTQLLNIYKCLSMLALKYALCEINNCRNKVAYDCMMFSEMSYLDIINDEMYVDINHVILGKADIDSLQKYEKLDISLKPPKDSFVF